MSFLKYFFTVFFTGMSLLIFAQQTPVLKYNGIIEKIDLSGLSVLSQNLIYSKINSRENSTLSPRTISNDLQRLYRLGYFADIQADLQPLGEERWHLIFKFREKPQIESIRFEGNRHLTEEDLVKLIRTYPFNMVDKRRFLDDIQSIREEYKKERLYRTSIDYRLDKKDNGKVDLVYIIQEDQKIFLTDINITGTKFFYPLDIRRRMISAEIESAYWITASGVYDELRINQDLQIIRQTYLQEGFIKVSIDHPKIRLYENPEYSRIEIDLHIREGERYSTGKIRVESADNNDLLLPDQKILSGMSLKPGDFYNPFTQNQDRSYLLQLYHERGYAFTQVRAETDIDETSRLVNITYKVIRDEKAYVDRIAIKGNATTRDFVIRRELAIFDQELYNGKKIQESRSNLQQLGYFTPTGVRFNQKTDESRFGNLNYLIGLDEAQTGSFRGSITYQENSGLGIQLSIAKDNFLGLGQRVSAQVSGSANGNQTFDINFFEPRLFGSKYSSSSNVFRSTTTGTRFNTKSIGASQGFGYSIWKNWRTNLTAFYNQSEYSNISDIGKISLDHEENSYSHSVQLGLNYNSVNNPRFPSKGSLFSLSSREYGNFLGGTEEYRRVNLSYRYFLALNRTKSVIFSARYRASKLLKTSSKNIPYAARLALGGITSVRGFDFGEIEGPASSAEFSRGFKPDNLNDPSSDQYDQNTYNYYIRHTGGTFQSLINLEVLFPITREGENFKGVVFMDAGNVWADEKRMYEITGAKNDFWYYRSSYGAGIRIITPAGVLRFEYGQKLNALPTESSGKFHFHISNLF